MREVPPPAKLPVRDLRREILKSGITHRSPKPSINPFPTPTYTPSNSYHSFESSVLPASFYVKNQDKFFPVLASVPKTSEAASISLRRGHSNPQ